MCKTVLCTILPRCLQLKLLYFTKKFSILFLEIKMIKNDWKNMTFYFVGF